MNVKKEPKEIQSLHPTRISWNCKRFVHQFFVYANVAGPFDDRRCWYQHRLAAMGTKETRRGGIFRGRRQACAIKTILSALAQRPGLQQ